MKRSSEEVEVEGTPQCTSIDSSNTDDLNKKQKVIGGDDEPQPQLHLMPITPPIPPVEAPLPSTTPDDDKKKLSYKMPKNKVYSSKDYALWPTIAYNVYRAQVNIHNSDYASDFMRYWFKEHQGLRTPPPKPPRSAYSIYFNEQKSAWCQTHGKFNPKKDGKKIGANWKGLNEDDKQVYNNRLVVEKNQYNANNDFWRAEAAAWRLEKVQRLKASGEEVDPVKRAALRLNDVCACELCKPTQD